MKFKDYFNNYLELKEANAGVMDNPHVIALAKIIYSQWMSIVGQFSDDKIPIIDNYTLDSIKSLKIPSGASEYTLNNITYKFNTYVIFDVNATAKDFDISGAYTEFDQNRTRPIKFKNKYKLDGLEFISKYMLDMYIKNIDQKSNTINVVLKLNPYYSFHDYKKIIFMIEPIAYHEASHLYDIIVGMRRGSNTKTNNTNDIKYYLNPIELRAFIAAIAVELRDDKLKGKDFKTALNDSINWIGYKKKIAELERYNKENPESVQSYSKKINKMRSKLVHYWNNNLK